MTGERISLEDFVESRPDIERFDLMFYWSYRSLNYLDDDGVKNYYLLCSWAGKDEELSFLGERFEFLRWAENGYGDYYPELTAEEWAKKVIDRRWGKTLEYDHQGEDYQYGDGSVWMHEHDFFEALKDPDCWGFTWELCYYAGDVNQHYYAWEMPLRFVSEDTGARRWETTGRRPWHASQKIGRAPGR